MHSRIVNDRADSGLQIRVSSVPDAIRVDCELAASEAYLVKAEAFFFSRTLALLVAMLRGSVSTIVTLLSFQGVNYFSVHGFHYHSERRR